MAERKQLVDDLENNEIEFMTINNAGKVLHHFYTAYPDRHWGRSKAWGVGNTYYRVATPGFTCSAGQTVFARIVGDRNIYQGTCIKR